MIIVTESRCRSWCSHSGHGTVAGSMGQSMPLYVAAPCGCRYLSIADGMPSQVALLVYGYLAIAEHAIAGGTTCLSLLV